MGKPFRDKDKWRIRWTDENGKRQSENFESYTVALSECKKREAEVEDIKNGLRNPRPLDKTFDEIADYWVTNRLPQKRCQKDDLSILRAHLRPAFGGLKLKDIDIAQVDRFVAERMHLNPKTVSNFLTLLISLLNLAVDLNWGIQKAPNIRKPKVPKRKDFYYLRTTEEINRFLTAAAKEDEIAYLMYATAIYTGLRAGELAALRFSNIRFDGPRSLITITNSFKNPTKSGEIRHIPILAPLYKLLLEWKAKIGGCDLVFPNRKGRMFQESDRIFQESFKRVLDRARFPKVTRNGRELHYLTFHGLRHTFASHWMMNGGEIFKLQKILGHQSIEMTLRYSHLSPAAYAGDFDRLGNCAPGTQNATISQLHTAMKN